MNIKNFRFCMICLVGLFLLLSLCTYQTFAEEKGAIKIGILLPLSGIYTQFGKDMVSGCEAYAEKVGYKMGGRKIEFLIEDSEGVPATALIKVKRLKEMNNIQIMIGPNMANETYALLPYINSKSLPTIVTGSADDVTQSKRSKYCIRGVQGPSQGTHVLGDYAHKVLGYRKIAAVVPDYAFGWENMGGLQRTFEELGGKITQKFWFPMTTSDFSPYLTQISKDNDAVFACLGGKVAITLIRQYREYGLKDKIPLIGLGTFPDETILPQVGDDALGIISALQYSVALDTAANREFVKKYVERFGKRPTAPTENSYTIMQLIDHALTSLKGDVSDPEKVAKALRPGGVIEATRGPLRFDAYGGIDMNIYIRKVERVGGELQNTVIYTYPLVSQFWKYDPKEYLKQPVYTRDYSPRKP